MLHRKKTLEKKIEKTLVQLACGEVSDAVSLLYLSDEEALQRLPQLNLFNISEIKRPKGGGLEIKFFDRIKACERLSSNGADNETEGLSFYEALEKSAENIGRVVIDD